MYMYLKIWHKIKNIAHLQAGDNLILLICILGAISNCSSADKGLSHIAHLQARNHLTLLSHTG
jgi:hypothetical protein